MDADAIRRHYGLSRGYRHEIISRKRPRREAAILGTESRSSTTGLGRILGSAAAAYGSSGDPRALALGGSIGDAIESNLPYIGEKIVEGYQGMKRFFGMGDYELKSNSLISGGMSSGAMQVIPVGQRAIRIVYREYIGDVYTHPTTAGAFNVQSYVLNPGLVSVFPWMAPIAQQYDEWSPNGIVFEFKSTSSEYVATQALGSVIMATEYDVLDAAPANKQTMLNLAYSNEAKPSCGILHGIECDPRDTPNRIFFTRSGAIPSGADQRDYDLATFYVATQGGSTANLNLGSLYVHYDITLRKEQIFNGIPMKGQLWATVMPTANTLSAGFPLGTAWPTTFGTMKLGTDFQISSTKITLPTFTVGARWMIQWVAGGTTGIALSYPTLTYAGCSLVSTFDAPSYAGGLAGDTVKNAVQMYSVDQTSPTASITYGTAGVFPNGTSAFILVWQIYSPN